MKGNYEIIRGAIIVLAFVLLIGAILFRWLTRSRDHPIWLIAKWIITIPLVALCLVSIPIAGPFAPFIVVFCGIILSMLWTPNIGGWMIKPITSLFDGGDVEPERRPAYSIARTKRNRGQYLEAITEIRKQLDRFPNDLEGHMLLAAIQAENLNDLAGAEVTLNRFCDQPKRSARQVAAAMNQLADWHLHFSKNVEAARHALGKIQTRFPDTEYALLAAQRIAHLAEPEHLLAAHDPKTVPVPHEVEYLGLEKDLSRFKPREPDPQKLAEDYVKHLEQHPLDMEAREKLAVLYAEHFGRLDLATDQLQQLMQLRADSPQHVAHWLNLLADLQIKGGLDYDTVRTTLLTIADLHPHSTVAEVARNRLDRLRLEFKAKEKSQAVPLGSYEQRLGLKMKR